MGSYSVLLMFDVGLELSGVGLHVKTWGVSWDDGNACVVVDNSCGEFATFV